jgi:hypothetical protein
MTVGETIATGAVAMAGSGAMSLAIHYGMTPTGFIRALRVAVVDAERT